MAAQLPASAGRRSTVRRPALLLFLSGLLLGLTPAPAIQAQTGQAAQPAPGGPYAVDIAEAAHRFGIPAAWIAAVLAAESNADPAAVSKAGAMGLMQLMPETARDLGVDDPYDPFQNVMAGTGYLKTLLHRYNGDTNTALAAYNWGMGNVERNPGRLPEETKTYIARITQYRDEAAV